DCRIRHLYARFVLDLKLECGSKFATGRGEAPPLQAGYLYGPQWISRNAHPVVPARRSAATSAIAPASATPLHAAGGSGTACASLARSSITRSLKSALVRLPDSSGVRSRSSQKSRNFSGPGAPVIL